MAYAVNAINYKEAQVEGTVLGRSNADCTVSFQNVFRYGVFTTMKSGTTPAFTFRLVRVPEHRTYTRNESLLNQKMPV